MLSVSGGRTRSDRLRAAVVLLDGTAREGKMPRRKARGPNQRDEAADASPEQAPASPPGKEHAAEGDIPCEEPQNASDPTDVGASTATGISDAEAERRLQQFARIYVTGAKRAALARRKSPATKPGDGTRDADEPGQ